MRSLDKLQKLIDQATGGVWSLRWDGTIGSSPQLHIHKAGAVTIPGGDKSKANARLIVTAVKLLPLLMDVVRRAEEVYHCNDYIYDHEFERAIESLEDTIENLE